MRIELFDPDKKTPDEHASFTLNWTRALGWSSNPFDPDVNLIAGMEDERQQINLFFIKNRSFGIISAKTGMGKTTLLQWLNDQLESYENLDSHLLHAKRVANAEELRLVLARPYRMAFSKKKPISTHELTELLQKKVKGRYVLLIDDLDALNADSLEAITAILSIKASVIATTEKKPKKLPGDDELSLALTSRSAEDYERILRQRIEHVGGVGIQPFTTDQLKKLAKAASSTQEFLNTAQEVAIELALKQVSADSDQPLTDDPEETPSKIGKQKRYDDLIESLTKD